jgi:hypothetical protein
MEGLGKLKMFSDLMNHTQTDLNGKRTCAGQIVINFSEEEIVRIHGRVQIP